MPTTQQEPAVAVELRAMQLKSPSTDERQQKKSTRRKLAITHMKYSFGGTYICMWRILCNKRQDHTYPCALPPNKTGDFIYVQKFNKIFHYRRLLWYGIADEEDL